MLDDDQLLPVSPGCKSNLGYPAPLQWVAIDEDSVLAIYRRDNGFDIDRLDFNNDLTAAAFYTLGQPGASPWSAKKQARK
ncbi:MAG: hypothetical protein JWN70_4381 [Planctomycetaceae bacterium]|nr:hypothetical protein [Planctomycetaceae bacterium]